MENEIEPDLFSLLCQLATFSEWHSPKFGRFDFQPGEDALRKIFPWESSFTVVQSGSLSERLYLPSLKAVEPVEGGSVSGSLSYEADLDVMFMPQKTIIKEVAGVDQKQEAAEVGSEEHESISEVVAFIENADEPRYVKLRVNTSCKWKLPDEILESEGNSVYISSSKFCEIFRKHVNHVQEAVVAAGPALLVTGPEHLQQRVSYGILESVDLVFAFLCPHWPSVAHEWGIRKRNWPQSETIQTLLQQGCAAVAKGSGTTSTSHLEWRLSFSFAETELARNLNPVQRRCYLVVKNVVKGLKCNVIPSYGIKCAFLWFLEEADPGFWGNASLGDCVIAVIRRLASFLQCYALPNYFVKQRNLLQTVSKESCEVMSKALMEFTEKPISSLVNSPDLGLMKCIESVLSLAPKEDESYSKLIALLRELDSSPEKKSDLKMFLKYHFINLGLTLMMDPKGAQKGLEFIQCVVEILKGFGKRTNALELLCNSLVTCSVRGDEEVGTASRLVSMRCLGFSDEEIISTLMKSTGDCFEVPANLYHNAGCVYHARAYEDSFDEPDEGLLCQAEEMLKKAVDLQPDSACHHVELSMFLYRNDRFEEAITSAKQGIEESRSSEELEDLGYDKSEETTLDGNLGYHVQHNDVIQAPALVFAYYVLVTCLVELDRKDEALPLMESYKTACCDPRKTNSNDDSLVLFNYSCLRLKIPKV